VNTSATPLVSLLVASRFSWSAKLVILALVALGVFVSSARTLTRHGNPLARPRGLARWSLLGEIGDPDPEPASTAAAAETHPGEHPEPALLPRLILKLRQRIAGGTPLRRQKIPPLPSSDAALSD